jgi:hypothetical protein
MLVRQLCNTFAKIAHAIAPKKTAPIKVEAVLNASDLNLAPSLTAWLAPPASVS